MNWKLAAACLAFSFVAACATSEPPPPQMVPADHNGPPQLPPPANDPTAISAERMSEITRVLASDEFQGRSMGGPGEEKTIAYLGTTENDPGEGPHEDEPDRRDTASG